MLKGQWKKEEVEGMRRWEAEVRVEVDAGVEADAGEEWHRKIHSTRRRKRTEGGGHRDSRRRKKKRMKKRWDITRRSEDGGGRGKAGGEVGAEAEDRKATDRAERYCETDGQRTRNDIIMI